MVNLISDAGQTRGRQLFNVMQGRVDITLARDSNSIHLRETG